MAPIATASVLILPNMTLFTSTVAAGVRSANFAALGATQGGLFGAGFSRSAGKLIAAGLIIGFGVLVKEAAQAAGNFEAQMVRLTTSAGETGTLVSGNLKMVAEGIKQMAPAVGYTLDQLAAGMYVVESAAFRGADGLKVLRAAAEAAKAENSDLKTVTDALTTTMVDYHKPADMAAEVMNKLLAAAATSKVTLQDLASSLHSVLPAASAAGIGLEDILGALSAMTLHGYSAQQATQNLADVIRHMQNPTNVQARELALLGLTTNQLARDLKEKGLTGTLQMISDRIKNLMPPGSQQVVANLQTAFARLTPEVQKLAQKLLDGTISFADYRKAARDLTPVQNAQAMSFYTLAASTHRIGDEQMTGAKVLQTYTAALARATGDATGLNVALMLTGANAETTNNIVGQIGKAALEAGGHVKGWAAIQETFNFKLAATKAALQVVGVAIGSSLLPVLGQMFRGLTAILGPMASWITDHQRITAVIASSITVFLALGTAVLIVGKLAAGLRILAAALRLAAIAQFLFLSPWGLIILAITAVVAALVYAYFHFDGFRKVVDTVFRAIMVVVRLWWEYAKFAFEQWSNLIMNVVVPAAIWLWKNALEPAFKAIVFVIKAWWEYAQFAFQAWRTIIMDYVVPAVMWLWHNVILPAFEAMVIIVRNAWVAIKFVFDALKAAVDIIGTVIMWMWHSVFEPTFSAIAHILQAWWVIAQVIFQAVKITVDSFVVQPILFLWHNVMEPAWQAIQFLIALAWATIRPIFVAIGDAANFLGDVFIALWHTKIEPVWNGIKLAIALAWEAIKPIFQAMINFVTDTIPAGFRKGVDLAKAAWDGLRTAVMAPINWVIQYVINDGIIKAWNWLAEKFGVKDRIGNVPLIGASGTSGSGGGGGGGTARAMADGGPIRGVGGPRQDNIPIMASAGEYIIPAHVVRGIGVGFFDSLIGKRKGVDKAGDGSAGIAIGHYADGGLIDFFMQGPTKWVGDRVNGLIDKIPGGGMVREISVAASRRLVDMLIKWAETKMASLIGGDSAIINLDGGLQGIMAWLFAQHGKPYGWAQAGPGSYDCSGIISAVWNLMHGRNAYSHTFSTRNEAPFFPKVGQTGIFTVGWANPGERGGGSVGHTAGNFAGVGVESTGSRGVRIGVGTTPVTNFAHWGTFADGGLIRSFDRGGRWPTGTIGANTSGRTEYVSTGGEMSDLIEVVRENNMLTRRLINAVEAIPGGVGAELTGASSRMRQIARLR